jgi:uncharacterized protein RhaS with RHS repeats
MGARVYDPYTGTFTQPDPIQGGGANAYGYTDGDPVNETDLTGASVVGDECYQDHNCPEESTHATGDPLAAIGHFIEHTYGTIAQIGAGTACLVASGGVCAGLLIAGLATDTAQNLASKLGRELLDVAGAIPGGRGAGLEMLNDADRFGSLGRAIGSTDHLSSVRRFGAAISVGMEGAKRMVGQ